MADDLKEAIKQNAEGPAEAPGSRPDGVVGREAPR